MSRAQTYCLLRLVLDAGSEKVDLLAAFEPYPSFWDLFWQSWSDQVLSPFSSVVFVALVKNSEPAVLLLHSQDIKSISFFSFLSFCQSCVFHVSSLETFHFCQWRGYNALYHRSLGLCVWSLLWAKRLQVLNIFNVFVLGVQRFYRDILEKYQSWNKLRAFWAEIGIFINSSSFGFTEAALCSYIQSSLEKTIFTKEAHWARAKWNTNELKKKFPTPSSPNYLGTVSMMQGVL